MREGERESISTEYLRVTGGVYHYSWCMHSKQSRCDHRSGGAMDMATKGNELPLIQADWNAVNY